MKIANNKTQNMIRKLADCTTDQIISEVSSDLGACPHVAVGW